MTVTGTLWDSMMQNIKDADKTAFELTLHDYILEVYYNEIEKSLGPDLDVGYGL